MKTIADVYEKYKHLDTPLTDLTMLWGQSFKGAMLRECWAAIKAAATEPAYQPIVAFVARVNARAEADMLKGNPVTGAHHRAIEAELAALIADAKEPA